MTAEPPHDPASTTIRQVAVGALFASVLLVLSLVAVLRWSAVNLAADALLQSIMSVQDVRWFFWGQNRFASVVPALLSPIADPAANLFATQLVNALSCYGLLLLLAALAVPALGERRGWRPVLVVFLLFAAVTQLLFEPLPLYFMALDAQPYALSWLLGLGSFLLWRAGPWWTTALGGVLAWLAIGLNPSVVLGVAVLAIGQLVRSRQWIRWPAFGLLWLAGLGAWAFVAARYPPVPGPFPSPDPDYYAFHLQLLTDGVSRSPLADARVLAEVDATAGFARSAGIHYVAGSYWYAWPVLHRMLGDGRDAAFATTVRSDGDPAAYRGPFDRDLAADRRPRAICVNDSADSCATYLTYWTEPGWSTTPVGTCPAPPLPDATAGTCVVLEFTGSPTS